MKNVAVLGSLASYGFGLSQRSNFDPCSSVTNFGVDRGTDQELTVASYSLNLAQCNAKLSLSGWPSLGYRIAPVVQYSRWSADRADGASKAEEFTFVPRTQFTLPIGVVKIDAIFGIGASYLSRAHIGFRRKSTNFQFSDEFGFGISDSSETFRIGLFFRHVSNADIASPNNAVDLRGVSISVRFR